MRWPIIVWVCLWLLFSVPWTSATPVPQWEHVRPPRVRAQSRVRPDHVLNVLFYVPLVPLGARLGYSLPGLVLAGATFSVVAEALQLFSLERSPDGNDVIANIGGTALGAGLVFITRRLRGAGRG